MTDYPWLLAANGERIDLTRPDRTTIRLDTIAHALGNICRFSGHTSPHYSVAAHSVHVACLAHAQIGTVGYQLGLLHDAHEAYVGDVPTPIKRVLGDSWRNLEWAWQCRVLGHFCMVEAYTEHQDVIKHADMVALATEREQLLPEGDWDIPLPPVDNCWRCSNDGVDFLRTLEVNFG